MNVFSWVFSCLFSWTGILFIGVIWALYTWANYHNDVFKRRGVPHLKATPFLGNTAGLFLRRETFIDSFMRVYWGHPKESVVGFMQGTQPLLIIRDIELIKEITVKNFEHFRNHMFSNDPDLDPIFGRSLFSMKDEKWKITRNMLSPAFTGSKMRIMFKLMHECSEKSVNTLIEKSKNNVMGIDLETKDFFTRYANDTIATTTFGIEVNSIKEPDNEFYKMGKIMTTFGPKGSAKFFLAMSAPAIFKVCQKYIYIFKVIN